MKSLKVPKSLFPAQELSSNFYTKLNYRTIVSKKTMSPRNEYPQTSNEDTPLVSSNKDNNTLELDNNDDISYDGDGNESSYSYCSIDGTDGPYNYQENNRSTFLSKVLVLLLGISLITLLSHHIHVSITDQQQQGGGSGSENDDDGNKNSSYINISSSSKMEQPIGPYKLIEKQEGMDFFNHYTFYEGADSLGSAGYNTYISKEEAETLEIVGVVNGTGTRTGTQQEEEFIFMKSSPTIKGPRSSIRLEGKRNFDRGLFILDLRHMPNGPGVWPAFWLTVSFQRKDKYFYYLVDHLIQLSILVFCGFILG